MIEGDILEQSVAAALELNQREIDHLVTLKQLRKTLEAALTKDLAEDVGRPIPGPLPLDTATTTPAAFKGNEKLAAIAEAEVLLSSLMRSTDRSF